MKLELIGAAAGVFVTLAAAYGVYLYFDHEVKRALRSLHGLS